MKIRRSARPDPPESDSTEASDPTEIVLSDEEGLMAVRAQSDHLSADQQEPAKTPILAGVAAGSRSTDRADKPTGRADKQRAPDINKPRASRPSSASATGHRGRTKVVSGPVVTPALDLLAPPPPFDLGSFIPATPGETSCDSPEKQTATGAQNASAGSEATGSEATGSEATGSEATGSEATGSEATTTIEAGEATNTDEDRPAGSNSGTSASCSSASHSPSTVPTLPTLGPDGNEETVTQAEERPLLGELLIDAELVDQQQLANALLHQAATGERVGDVLVRAGAIRERDLARMVATQSGLPYLDLSQVRLSPDATSRLPESVSRSLSALPVEIVDGVLTVAVADPEIATEALLHESSEGPVRLVVAAPSDLARSIDASYRALAQLGPIVAAFQADEEEMQPARPIVDTSGFADAPVVRVVDLLVTQALRDRASDVHIEPTDRRLRIRYRVDGNLVEAAELPLAMAPSLLSRIKIMAEMNIAERRRPQDGKMTMTIDGREIDLRVSTIATIWGEKCVIRLLDRSRSLLAMHELGMASSAHALLDRMVRAPSGMVVCAGPTGSGKTTTLYSILSRVDDPSRNIMTIEDPVEYVFPTMSQIQTNEAAGAGFAEGLRSILRQDPDIIMVGEIRDAETARTAVQSALTGHFVLSSIHATDSAGALHRFLDMGIESYLVASSVSGVLSQRLVRRTCESCKVTYEPDIEEMTFYRESGGPEKDTFYRGEGCAYCGGTGYHGRVGIFELLALTPEIRRLLVGWATQDEIQRLAVAQGMSTLQQEGMRAVSLDKTTISEVVRSLMGA